MLTIHRNKRSMRALLVQGSYPDSLLPAANSIVCTGGGALLTQLFNVTPSLERAISVPPRHCRTAADLCHHCLELNDCLAHNGTL